VLDARTQEIAAEQQVVDRVYERLDGMRAQAGALAGEGHRRAAAGPVTGLVERDAMVHRAAAQLRAIDAEAEGLVFGRLDFDDGETYHVGRLGVRDGLEPLLIDWRGARRRTVLPRHLGRAARRGAPPGHHVPRPEGHRPRRRCAVSG
jgi:DNA helicase IV